jgi:hypothetical protein
VAFSPDGKRLASGGALRFTYEVKVWDAETGQERLTLKGHTMGIRSVAFSPDGKRLASGGGDGAVKLWDTETGQERLNLKGHTDGVFSVAFSPDGKRLASAGQDRQVKVWNTGTGLEVLTLKGHKSAVWAVAFSPDGYWLASGSQDGTVRLWDARPYDADPRFWSREHGPYLSCWRIWGKRLVGRLREEGLREITRTIDEDFRREVGTADTVEFMRQPSFWGSHRPKGARSAPEGNILLRVGLEVVPLQNNRFEADRVTFRLAERPAP